MSTSFAQGQLENPNLEGVCKGLGLKRAKVKIDNPGVKGACSQGPSPVSAPVSSPNQERKQLHIISVEANIDLAMTNSGENQAGTEVIMESILPEEGNNHEAEVAEAQQVSSANCPGEV